MSNNLIREGTKKIDNIKSKLSNGESRIEKGRTIVEISLSDLNKLLEIAYEFEKENYELKKRLQGFVLWEEMFPVIKQYYESHPVLIDTDYETYRQLVSDSKKIINNSPDFN